MQNVHYYSFLSYRDSCRKLPLNVTHILDYENRHKKRKMFLRYQERNPKPVPIITNSAWILFQLWKRALKFLFIVFCLEGRTVLWKGCGVGDPQIWVTMFNENPQEGGLLKESFIKTKRQIYGCSSQLLVGSPCNERFGTLNETFQKCFTLLPRHWQTIWATGDRSGGGGGGGTTWEWWLDS